MTSKSTYYQERYDRIASNLRKLCRLYQTSYVDSFTSTLIENTKYESCQDRTIVKSFDSLCEKFLLSGRWTDKEMLQQMWRDFKILHLQACDDNRCPLQQSRLDTGYTAPHGMLHLLMLLANSPTQSGKAVYVSDDFVCLENLSMLIPIRKEYTDTSEYSQENDYSYDYWRMDYDDEPQDEAEEEGWTDLEEDLEVSSERCFEDSAINDDEPAVGKDLASGGSHALEDDDLQSYTLFGRDISSYPAAHSDISFAIDGSINPLADSIVSAATASVPNSFRCMEGDVVKLVLEMLMGSENELFLSSEDHSFLLAPAASRLRMSSESLSPLALENLLSWFAGAGTMAASCRAFASKPPTHNRRASQGTLFLHM